MVARCRGVACGTSTTSTAALCDAVRLVAKVLSSARSAALTPALVAFMASPALRERGTAAFRALQRIDPVHRSPLGLVILSRHADVSAVLRNPRFGSEESKADERLLKFALIERFLGAKKEEGVRAEFLHLFDDLMLFRDPPDHTRLRSLVSKAFTPKRVQALEPRVHELVDEMLTPLAKSRSMELMHDFAYPFPARVICELLGLPPDGEALFIEHAPSLAIALDPSPMRSAEGVARANEATRVLTAYLRGLIGLLRQDPQDDLLSALVHAESEGDSLSESELIATVLLLVIAGHETTANVIGNAMYRLLDRPEDRERIAAGDGPFVRCAVEELLRLDGPVQMVQRVALEQIELPSGPIDKGRIVVPLVGAANLDPEVFDEPTRLQLDRAPNPHLAFGAGHHFCIGAPLARLELAVALPALMSVSPDIRLAAATKRRRSFTIRGLETLPLAW